MGDLVSDLGRLSVSLCLLADVHRFSLLRVLRVHVSSNRFVMLMAEAHIPRARVLLLRSCVDLLRLLGSRFTGHQKVGQHVVVLRRLAHTRTVPVSLLTRRMVRPDNLLLSWRHLHRILLREHLVIVLATTLHPRRISTTVRSSVVALGSGAGAGRRLAIGRFVYGLFTAARGVFDQLLHQLAVVVVAGEVLLLGLGAGLPGRLFGLGLLGHCLLLLF